MLSSVHKWSKALTTSPDVQPLVRSLQGLAVRLVQAVYSTLRMLV